MQLYEIYELYQREIMKYARSLTAQRELAEDLCQQAYLKALDQIDLFSMMHPQQVKAWFFTTIKHLYIDGYRRQRRLILSESLPEEGFSYNHEDRLLLNQAIESLSPSLKIIVNLRYIQGYNSNEIALLLGLNASTVRSRLSQATRLLRQFLQE